MNANQAKKIPLIDVLAMLGHTPVRKDKGGIEWVYNSPFRNEAVPSLFVNIQKNVWNDFGDMGGNTLDFIIRYKNTNVKEALRLIDNLSSGTSFKANTVPKRKNITAETAKEKTLILDAVMPLKSYVLEQYLEKRSINTTIARKYLKVVQFHHAVTSAKYFGLGLQNMSGDYEIRNAKLKTVVGKKDISFIKGLLENTPNISVFESFTDFLSYLSDKEIAHLKSDVIILNSTKMITRAKEFISEKTYKTIYTFLDNDRSGEEARTSLSKLPNHIISCNHIYQGFKDYNEFLQKKVSKAD